MNWREEDYPEQGIHLWILQDDIKTEYHFEDVPYIYLLNEDVSNLSDINQFNLKQVKFIKNNINLFFTKGVEYLKNELKNDPNIFGIDKNKAFEYSSLPNDKFPVDFPKLTFYPDRKWLMRFADANFPIVNYGHGIAIDFNQNNEPESFSILPEE